MRVRLVRNVVKKRQCPFWVCHRPHVTFEVVSAVMTLLACQKGYRGQRQHVLGPV